MHFKRDSEWSEVGSACTGRRINRLFGSAKGNRHKAIITAKYLWCLRELFIFQSFIMCDIGPDYAQVSDSEDVF
eukprot:m.222597 g.222597  ORF g.222597 m.222597 type:complete len:74 (-) comp15627_c0_seq3:474-695(-)